MIDKPKIYGFCPAGCKWETVHKEDFEKSATFVKLNAENTLGFIIDNPVNRFKIIPKNISNGSYGVTLYFKYKDSILGDSFELEFTEFDEYRDYFYFEILKITVTETGTTVVYEVNGNRYKKSVTNVTSSDVEIMRIEIVGAETVYLFNKDANVEAEKADSVFIRYSANADGTDFTETWTSGQNYIGIATAKTAPIDKTAYTWCKFIN